MIRRPLILIIILICHFTTRTSLAQITTSEITVEQSGKTIISDDTEFMGKVGIGVTQPTESLEVAGNLAVSGTISVPFISGPSYYLYLKGNGPGFYLVNSTSNGEPDFIHWLGGSGSARHMRIGTDVGHYGDAAMEIYQHYLGGPLSYPGKVYVNGQLWYGSIHTLSDSRLKKDISPISSSLSKITQLNGVSFRWKKDEKQDVGLLAQDVAQVFPELIGIDSRDSTKLSYLGVNYIGLIAPMIEAIKELNAEVESLKSELSKLKSVKN